MLCAVCAQSKMRRVIIVPIIPMLCFYNCLIWGQAKLANYFIPKWKIIKGHASAKLGERD